MSDSDIHLVRENKTSILQIPTNILLTIFSYLDLKSLCLTSRVCRLWNTYANDRSLWKILDLRPYQYNLRSLWKIINRRLTEHCKELYIRGYLSKTKKLVNLSTPFLEQIKKRAPYLSNLTLHSCDLNDIDVASFPNSITILSLPHSQVPFRWFDALKSKDVFPCVQDLELSYCTRISSEDIASICCLQTLNVSDCRKLTDVSLHHIGRNLKSLQRLCLRNCHLVSPVGLASLKVCAVSLKYLDLAGCSETTQSEALNIFLDSQINLITSQLHHEGESSIQNY